MVEHGARARLTLTLALAPTPTPTLTLTLTRCSSTARGRSGPGRRSLRSTSFLGAACTWLGSRWRYSIIACGPHVTPRAKCGGTSSGWSGRCTWGRWITCEGGTASRRHMMGCASTLPTPSKPWVRQAANPNPNPNPDPNPNPNSNPNPNQGPIAARYRSSRRATLTKA